VSKKGVFGTIIGSDIHISGDMQFVGKALIEGYFEGNIKAEENDSKLTISEGGHVKGSVAVPHLLVNGMIEGDVCVAEHLECGQKARIIGDVQYNQMEIAVGGQVDGKLSPKSEGEIVEEDKKTGAELSSGKTAPSDAV